MSHRWDSHWKKHGRSGPSPFAATPSHREQWQAQLNKLKQKAAYRRAHQQAAHPSEQAGYQHNQPQWSPQPQQSEEQQQTGEQHSREPQREPIPGTGLKGHQQQGPIPGTGTRGHQQNEPIPGTDFEGHQQVVHVGLHSQSRADSQIWQGGHHQAAAHEMQPAVNGHAPLRQSSGINGVQKHACPSQAHIPSFEQQSTGHVPNHCTQAVEPQSHTPADQSSGLLVVLLTHQLLQQLHWHGQSLQWAVHLNGMMGAAMQHVQGTHSGLHNSSRPGGNALFARDPALDATADVKVHGFHLDPMPSNAEMLAAHQHEQYSPTHEKRVPASGKEHMVADENQNNTQGHNNGPALFQTQHRQVQSQLAGLKRRAARKHSA